MLVISYDNPFDCLANEDILRKIALKQVTNHVCSISFIRTDSKFSKKIHLELTHNFKFTSEERGKVLFSRGKGQ